MTKGSILMTKGLPKKVVVDLVIRFGKVQFDIEDVLLSGQGIFLSHFPCKKIAHDATSLHKSGLLAVYQIWHHRLQSFCQDLGHNLIHCC